MKLFSKLKFHKKHLIKYLKDQTTNEYTFLEYEFVNNEYFVVSNATQNVLENIKCFVIAGKFYNYKNFTKEKKMLKNRFIY